MLTGLNVCNQQDYTLIAQQKVPFRATSTTLRLSKKIRRHQNRYLISAFSYKAADNEFHSLQKKSIACLLLADYYNTIKECVS